MNKIYIPTFDELYSEYRKLEKHEFEDLCEYQYVIFHSQKWNRIILAQIIKPLNKTCYLTYKMNKGLSTESTCEHHIEYLELDGNSIYIPIHCVSYPE